MLQHDDDLIRDDDLEPVEPEVEDDRDGWHADRAADRYERTVLAR